MNGERMRVKRPDSRERSERGADPVWRSDGWRARVYLEICASVLEDAEHDREKSQARAQLVYKRLSGAGRCRMRTYAQTRAT